jgi:UPF0755 protein
VAVTLRRWLGIGVLTALLAALTLAGLGWWAWDLVQRPLGSADAAPILFEVESGRPAMAILEDLETAGVIRDRRLARAYLQWWLDDPPLRAGEYRFEPPLTTPEVLDVLIRGDVVTYPVTIIEGLTLEETAQAIAAAGFGSVDGLQFQMQRSELVADLDPEAFDLEGYLFPDTYSFPRGTTEATVVETLVATFRRRWEQDVAPLVEGPADVRSLVTLASIVEKEARLDEERPVIAGVYVNRLERGMGLYADPTIIYAKKKAGTWDGNLRRPDLQLDSPYNTYVVSGLPPGPIASPGLASLQAAAAPADVPYLYFVSRNDGSHVFARTLAEHNRNVEEWQRRYWRERWARERAAGGDPPDRDNPPKR